MKLVGKMKTDEEISTLFDFLSPQAIQLICEVSFDNARSHLFNLIVFILKIGSAQRGV